MNSIERVYTTISHKEPDKVPKGELDIHKELIRKILMIQRQPTFEDEIAVRKKLKIDLVCTAADTSSDFVNVYGGIADPIKIGKDSSDNIIYRDVWGNEVVFTYRDSVQSIRYIKPILSNISDIYSYKFPSIDRFCTSGIKRWVEETDFFVASFVGGGFDNAMPLVGEEDFLIYTITRRDEIKELIRKFTEFNTELAIKYIEAGSKLIFIGDDICSNKGPLVSPKILREILFPYLAKMVSKIKERKIPVFLHCDANVNDILEDVVNMGFDGIQSLQRSANVDIGEVKKKFGKKLCLMGNVDLDRTLPLGTTQDVENEVKSIIKNAGMGGGFILSTTNVMVWNTPVENALAMYKSAEEFGKYPIAVWTKLIW